MGPVPTSDHILHLVLILDIPVLCANKALLDASPSLSSHLTPIISPRTSIVLLQNGVGAEAPLHESFPNNTIISAVVWTGGRTLPDQDGMAVVENFNREKLTIGVDYREGGDKAEEDEKLARLIGVLESGGGTCERVESIQAERWIKVIWYVYAAITCSPVYRCMAYAIAAES